MLYDAMSYRRRAEKEAAQPCGNIGVIGMKTLIYIIFIFCILGFNLFSSDN